MSVHLHQVGVDCLASLILQSCRSHDDTVTMVKSVVVINVAYGSDGEKWNWAKNPLFNKSNKISIFFGDNDSLFKLKVEIDTNDMLAWKKRGIRKNKTSARC